MAKIIPFPIAKPSPAPKDPEGPAAIQPAPGAGERIEAVAKAA
jgi:hypothetical protein